MWIGLWRSLKWSSRYTEDSVEAHSPSDKWELFRQTLRSTVTPITWQTWLTGLQLNNIEDTTVHLTAPSEFHLRWVNDKHRTVIEEAIRTVFGAETNLSLHARPAPEHPPADVEDEFDDLPAAPPEPAAEEPQKPSRIVPKYSFENFVVGPSNRFAHAAAMAIAEQPGGHYNPLFIYAAAGLGKTHLLQAIALHARTLHNGLRVRYVTSEHFFNDFIEGLPPELKPGCVRHRAGHRKG